MPAKTDISIILASASPRRAELLLKAGYTFKIIPSTIEETITKGTPDQLAESLAFQKADNVYKTCKPDYEGKDYMVIGADTIVFYDGDVLGKPDGEQEAFNMLKMLSDRTHQVYTGLSIIIRINGEKRTHILHERTDVTFYPINDYDIKDYIATGDCLDKAGAYGIQGQFAIHVKEIKGDYNNVVGLPIARLYQTLNNCGLSPKTQSMHKFCLPNHQI